MSSDMETIESTSCGGYKNSDGDFPSMFMDLIKKINFKIAIFIYILGVFLFSDVFINIMPNKYSDAGCPNTPGTLIQLLLLVIGYIFIDIMVTNKML